MAVWRRGEGVTRRVSCMERHTAKYSEIQPNSIQPAIQPCRACRGSGAWPGCAQAAVHAAMGAGYRPTPSVTPSSPTGTLSACVSVRHLVLYSRNTIQLTIQLYCSIHVSRIVTPSPRRHTAIQRHTALYEHTAIQHHTAYTPYNTPQNRAKLTCQGRGAELVFGLEILILAELSPVFFLCRSKSFLEALKGRNRTGRPWV